MQHIKAIKSLMDIGNQCNKHNAKIELQTRCYTSPILLLISKSGYSYDLKTGIRN